MPQKSGFFDSTADDMREYPARDFAEYFAKLITNGVFNGGQYLNPTATGLDAYISLSIGSAWINGYVYSVYDSSLVLPIEPAAALDRIDRIILRLDTSTPVRNIRAIVLQGLPGSNPTPPALVRSGNIYDLSIAQVRVKANSTIVLPANIKDERLDNAVCGLVNSLIRVDTTTFQQQWDAFIASVQNQGFVTTTVFNAHVADNSKHVPHLGTTTNSGNSYSITTTETIKTDQKFTIKINAASTGAANLSVSTIASGVAKSIVKPGGANATLKVGIYTVFWDGMSFQLLGEGGGPQTASGSGVTDGTVGKQIVTGLSFRPKKVIVSCSSTTYMRLTNISDSSDFYSSQVKGSKVKSIISSVYFSGSSQGTITMSDNSGNNSILDNGFTFVGMPDAGYNAPFEWWAFEKEDV